LDQQTAAQTYEGLRKHDSRADDKPIKKQDVMNVQVRVIEGH
jgi:hypothetical protein